MFRFGTSGGGPLIVADTLLDEALAAHAAGLTVVPPRQDGTKRPDGTWKHYETTRPTVEAIRAQYANGRTGLGVVCGATSGNLEMLELDHPAAGLDRDGTWRALCDTARTAGCYDLLERVILGYAEITPSGGVHLLYRCTGPVDGNTKLARRPATTDELAANPADPVRVIFETRGEGGYVVLAPSHGTVHPTGHPWVRRTGSFATIATVTPDERHQLLDLARTFDTLPDTRPAPGPPPEPAGRPQPSPSTTASGSWMDDTIAAFNNATTWGQILAPHGWTEMRPDGAVSKWCRPGKDPRDGHSATINANGTDRLILWSTSVAIPGVTAGDHSSYDRFSIWAGYHHGGDRQAAAEAARKAGHGPEWTERTDVDLYALTGQQPPTGGPSPAVVEHHQAPPLLELRWTDQMVGNLEPEPPELVEGVLRRGELAALAAPRAIGKTFVGLNMAAQLATGEGHLFGRLAIRRPARVLYLQGELDRWGSQERWFGLYGVTDIAQLAGQAPQIPRVAETFDPVRIRTITRRNTIKIDGQTMVDEYVDAVIDPRIEATIRNEGIDVVIVDPWAVYFAGKENSNDEVEAALAQLRAITLRTGVAWVVIHHISAKIETNRLTEPEDLWRGATRLADWASTRITILPHYTESKRTELGLSRYDARRHVNVHFLRRSKPVDDFTARRRTDGWWEAWDDPDAPQEGGPATSTTGRPTTVSPLDIVQALLHDGGTWASVTEAAASLDCSRPTAERAIHRAVKLRHCYWTTGPRGSKGIRLATPDELAGDADDLHETTFARNPNDLHETVSCRSETPPDQGKQS